REMYRYRAVLTNIVSEDLRIRYQRSLLGFLWTLLNPILMLGTLSLVFTRLFNFENSGSYALYQFSRMVPWGMFYSTIFEGSTCIIVNESLIRKIYVPKLVFPLSRLLLNATMLVLSMGALFLLMVPLGARFTPSMLLLPVVMALFAAFTLGITLI